MQQKHYKLKLLHKAELKPFLLRRKLRLKLLALLRRQINMLRFSNQKAKQKGYVSLA